MKGITELYAWIRWEVLADTLGSVEHILGTNELPESKIIPCEKQTHLQPLKKTPTAPLRRNRELTTVFTAPATVPRPEPD